MDVDDPGGYAELWLAELGAYVPEHSGGAARPSREFGFGLHLSEPERARRHGAALTRERGIRRA